MCVHACQCKHCQHLKKLWKSVVGGYVAEFMWSLRKGQKKNGKLCKGKKILGTKHNLKQEKTISMFWLFIYSMHVLCLPKIGLLFQLPTAEQTVPLSLCRSKFIIWPSSRLTNVVFCILVCGSGSRTTRIQANCEYHHCNYFDWLTDF